MCAFSCSASRLACLFGVVACLLMGTAVGCATSNTSVFVRVRTVIDYPADTPDLVTTHTLDDHGNAVQTVEVQGKSRMVMDVSYDPYGIPVEALGNPIDIQIETDAHNRPVRVLVNTGLDSGEETYAYFGISDRIETATVAHDNGESRTVCYNQDGWPLTATTTSEDGTQSTTTYTYAADNQGRPVSAVVRLDEFAPQEFALAYNENGRLETLTGSDGTVITYEYALVKDPSFFARARALVQLPLDG